MTPSTAVKRAGVDRWPTATWEPPGKTWAAEENDGSAPGGATGIHTTCGSKNVSGVVLAPTARGALR